MKIAYKLHEKSKKNTENAGKFSTFGDSPAAEVPASLNSEAGASFGWFTFNFYAIYIQFSFNSEVRK